MGLILLNRLVELCGRELRGGRAFPEPRDLKSADREQLVRLGYSHNYARSLMELSQAISEERFTLHFLERASDRECS